MSHMSVPSFFTYSDVATINEPSRPALSDPSVHPYHQTLKDFKNDIQNNWHILEKEYSLMHWLYPFAKQESCPKSPHSVLGWGAYDTCNEEPNNGRTYQIVISKEQENRTKASDGNFSGLQFTEWDGTYNSNSEPIINKNTTRRNSKRQLKTSMKIQVKDTTKSSMPSTKPRSSPKRLTVEQKRSNHIRHEQKRRGLIRDGFNELTVLIPELQGGTWSRSRILFKAAESLQTLIKSNEALQQELDTLRNEGRRM